MSTDTKAILNRWKSDCENLNNARDESDYDDIHLQEIQNSSTRIRYFKLTMT